MRMPTALVVCVAASIAARGEGQQGTVEQPGDAPAPFVMVLGVAQDGGYPQAACRRECCRAAYLDESLRRHVACLAIVDPVSHQRWIIDATPDFGEQLRMLDDAMPPRPETPGAASQAMLDGVFLTHAHIGHYTGLQNLGREVTGASGVPVFVMPRMEAFLVANGPWSQLVSLGNIDLKAMQAGEAVVLNERITVTPILVPHRDEFSETVAYRIDGPGASVLYLPDIDKWERWEHWGEMNPDMAGHARRIEDEIAAVDVAYLDATFFSGDELGGRDMSEIPHPSVQESLARFADLPESERAKIRLIHLNHTNPLLRNDTERAVVAGAGMAVAAQGERVTLDGN